jgi:hypothetical protein
MRKVMKILGQNRWPTDRDQNPVHLELIVSSLKSGILKKRTEKIVSCGVRKKGTSDNGRTARRAKS